MVFFIFEEMINPNNNELHYHWINRYDLHNKHDDAMKYAADAAKHCIPGDRRGGCNYPYTGRVIVAEMTAAFKSEVIVKEVMTIGM